MTDLGARQAGATHHVQNEIFGDLIATCVMIFERKAVVRSITRYIAHVCPEPILAININNIIVIYISFMHYILANRRVPSLATCAKKGGFPIFVPSLSWQKDRVYIYNGSKKAFSLFSHRRIRR
eukprot:COSAG06_NODE_1859_length_8205_cov_15.172095_11_plen_124_part_00